jgi:acetyl esterase/lipase
MKKISYVCKVIFLALMLTPLAHAFFGRVEFSEAGDFSEDAVSRGVQATREQCAKVSNAVWAVSSSAGQECIKYWAAGFSSEPAKRAIVFFHGDVWVGAGKTSQSYLEMSNEKMQESADTWAKRLGMPYIFVARPGTYGSSGDHMQRRRIAESVLISAALDELKKRYGIQELVLAGQSGGGHVTSSLITQRDDVICAVPTSAPSSPRIRWQMMGRTRDTTNFADSYEPSVHVRKDQVHAQLRVFVLGNPEDKNVFWPAQTVMADALKKAGIPVELLTGEGTGPDLHGLSNAARTVAGWCAKDLDTAEIVRRAAKGLKG